MSSFWGKNFKISLFGESHGEAIGITIDGLPAGISFDFEEIAFEMGRRKPQSKMSTPRRESDIPEILSGYFNNHTTGTALCAIIRNENKHSQDYTDLKNVMRPGHADYTGMLRYKGFNDYRGGGHFSGRITAALVFCGSLCRQILRKENIHVFSHIKRIAGIEDSSFDFAKVSSELEKSLKGEFPLLDISKEEQMREVIRNASAQGNSVGGIVETAITGLKAGFGDPFFDSVESVLSGLLFSVPAVKGLEFGAGFDVSKMMGSECNDKYYYTESGEVKTKTNNNGGILGGISNGMPIIFKAAIKPTASVFVEQETINIEQKKNDILKIEGRHDPCLVHRILTVIEAVTLIGLMDITFVKREGREF